MTHSETPLDRGDSVNLAENAVERYGTGVTAKGVYTLATAVLAMDVAPQEGER